MATVLGLIPDHGLGAVDHLSGDLLTAIGGQAMQHDGVRRRMAQQLSGQRVRREDRLPFVPVTLLSHRYPGVGRDDIGAGDGFDCRVGHTDAAT